MSCKEISSATPCPVPLAHPSGVVFCFAETIGAYTGQVITVHIDDPDSEAVATYTVDKTDWSDYTPVIIDLTKTIPAGKHSVHFKFNEYGTSNFFYFGFLPEEQ